MLKFNGVTLKISNTFMTLCWLLDNIMMVSLGWFVCDHVLLSAVDQSDVIWRQAFSHDVCFIWTACSLLIYWNFSVNTETLTQDIYLTVFAKTCLQLTLRQSQWPGVFWPPPWLGQYPPPHASTWQGRLQQGAMSTQNIQASPTNSTNTVNNKIIWHSNWQV